MFTIVINEDTKEWEIKFNDDVVPGVKRWTMNRKKAGKPPELVLVLDAEHVRAEIVKASKVEEQEAELEA